MTKRWHGRMRRLAGLGVLSAREAEALIALNPRLVTPGGFLTRFSSVVMERAVRAGRKSPEDARRMWLKTLEDFVDRVEQRR